MMPYGESNLDSPNLDSPPTNSAYPIHYIDLAIYTDHWTQLQIQFNAHLGPMTYLEGWRPRLHTCSVSPSGPSSFPPRQRRSCDLTVSLPSVSTMLTYSLIPNVIELSLHLLPYRKAVAEIMCCNLRKFGSEQQKGVKSSFIIFRIIRHFPWTNMWINAV
jgi:hypothetical protein